MGWAELTGCSTIEDLDLSSFVGVESDCRLGFARCRLLTMKLRIGHIVSRMS
jgi:hypothetical protein